MTQRLGVIGIVLLLLASAAFYWFARVPAVTNAAALPRHSSGPFTIVLTGDTMLTSAKAFDLRGVQPVAAIVRNSDIAFTNLESTFQDHAAVGDQPAWPAGGTAEATLFQKLGFNLISCANNHALDHGLGGMRATTDNLRRLGIAYSGCGPDLATARAPGLVTQAGLRVALISIATSASPESRATPRRGDIAGRGGVSALRFAVHVTLSPQSYRLLQGTGFAHPQGSNQLEFFGTTVTQGDATKVEYVSDAGDTKDLLNAIRAIRAHADIVIVSLHSHEPVNASPAPTKFVETLAHDAIDAGATIVVGHGPHRLRGMELFHGGMIFYSLGDFLYQRRGVSTAAYDAFDSGTDPQAPELAALSGVPPGEADPSVLKQGAMVVITFAQAKPVSAKLVPLGLGGDPASQDEIPHLATGAQAAAILDTVRQASKAYGTSLAADGLIGQGSAN